MDVFLQAAIEEARKGLAEGGIPIGSVLVLDGKIIGRGHNQRVQHGSVIHHAEMNCLENAGRLKASVYQRCVLYSTLSPCPMCSGAILLYKIPRVVVGENVTFQGPEEYVRSQGVKVEVLQDPACIQLMRDFIKARPDFGMRILACESQLIKALTKLTIQRKLKYVAPTRRSRLVGHTDRILPHRFDRRDACAHAASASCLRRTIGLLSPSTTGRVILT